MRQDVLLLVAAALSGAVQTPAWAQGSVAAKPRFEAAAIKLNRNCAMGGRGGGRPSPGRITLECAGLRDLILTAYEIYGGNANPASFRMQVLGGPAWVDSDRYDFAMKAEGNPPVAQMYGPMLQALLEERFGLRLHRETRDAPVFLLHVAKGGARLQVTEEGSCLPACGSIKTNPRGAIDMAGVTMPNLSTFLGMRLDREVIDKTGLAGRFNIHLEVSPAELSPRFVAGSSVTQLDSSLGVDSAGPSIFTALEQQLGLKLEPGKGPVTILVIDHIEQPSGN